MSSTVYTYLLLLHVYTEPVDGVMRGGEVETAVMEPKILCGDQDWPQIFFIFFFLRKLFSCL